MPGSVAASPPFGGNTLKIKNSRSASRGRRGNRRAALNGVTSSALPVPPAEYSHQERRHTHSYVPPMCHLQPPPRQAVTITGGRDGEGNASLSLVKKAAADRLMRRDSSAAVDPTAKCRAYVNEMLHGHGDVDGDGGAKKPLQAAVRRFTSKSAPATRRKPPVDVTTRPPFNLDTRIHGYSSSDGSDDEDQLDGALAAAGKRVVALRNRKKGDKRGDASVMHRPSMTRRGGAKTPTKLVSDEKADFNREWINSLRA